MNSIRRLGMLATLTAFVAACGGGGGDSPPAAPGGTQTGGTLVSGVASKGPLNGSTVCAFAIVNNSRSTGLGTCATNIANGIYSIDIGTYAGPVIFEATGGTYTDEATGTTVALASPLRSIVGAATGSEISVAITPLTELAYQDANSVVAGLTSARIQSAIVRVQDNFGVSDIVNTMPVNALDVPAGATAEQKKYALALATVSHYQKSQPPGTSLANALQTIQDCLTNPSSNCGSGTTSVSSRMNAAANTFQAAHPGFSGLTIPPSSFGVASTPTTALTFQTAYNRCFNDTPSLYTQEYCVAYANAIVVGSTPAQANIAGATVAVSNVGNIGMGGNVSDIGTPLSSTTSTYKAPYASCFTGTPDLYSSTYCAAYANAIVAGSTPTQANIAGATAANSNVGNIGMGGAVSASGTPLSGTSTCTAPQVLQGGVCVTPAPVPTCSATQQLVDGVCVARPVNCIAPQVLQGSVCVTPAPVPTCSATQQLVNGVCVSRPVTCTAPQVLQGSVCVTPAPVPTCSATQQLENGVCVARPLVCTPLSVPQGGVCVPICSATQKLVNGVCVAIPVSTAPSVLNGTVSLENVILGKRTMDVPWKDLFAWNGNPSYIPVLGNNLGETVTLMVCFARTSPNQPYGPNYYFSIAPCTTVNDFKPNTTVSVKNGQWWAHGEFKVYVIRDLALDPSKKQVLVATYSALDWGFVSVQEPPSNCLLNGSIANSKPECNIFASPAEGSPKVPSAPPVPATGVTTGAGASAANCVAVSRVAGSDKVTLTNNCGRNIFLMWCGEQKYTSRRCGSDANYYTHSTNSKPGEISQTKEIVLTSPTASFLFGACYGQISFGNNGDFKAWADGSYACLKPE